MELKDFIKTTLVQIVEGVHEAREAVRQHSVSQHGAEVSPRLHGGSTKDLRLSAGQGGDVAQIVEFDIGITVMESATKTGEGGGRIGVASFGATIGGTRETKAGSEAAHRVKFSVPIAMPRG